MPHFVLFDLDFLLLNHLLNHILLFPILFYFSILFYSSQSYYITICPIFFYSILFDFIAANKKHAHHKQHISKYPVAALALDSTSFREWSNVAKAIWSLSPLFRTSATVQRSALANVNGKEKWFYIVSLSSASHQLVREQSGHSKWRNSLLTHAYHWQIVPLRSWPWRVICARQRDTESLCLIGKGQCRNRQTSSRGAVEENCIFQS